MMTEHVLTALEILGTIAFAVLLQFYGVGNVVHVGCSGGGALVGGEIPLELAENPLDGRRKRGKRRGRADGKAVGFRDSGGGRVAFNGRNKER